MKEPRTGTSLMNLCSQKQNKKQVSSGNKEISLMIKYIS